MTLQSHVKYSSTSNLHLWRLQTRNWRLFYHQWLQFCVIWVTTRSHRNLHHQSARIPGLLLDIANVARLKNNLRYLSITDSQIAMYWLGKNKQNPVMFPMHDEVAQEIGKLFMETNLSGDRTHIRGILNLIRESLSRDSHFPHSFYLKKLRENEQTRNLLPKHFKNNE